MKNTMIVSSPGHLWSGLFGVYGQKSTIARAGARVVGFGSAGHVAGSATRSTLLSTEHALDYSQVNPIPVRVDVTLLT